MDDAQNTQLHWLRAPKLGLVLHGRKKFIFNHWRSCIEFLLFFVSASGVGLTVLAWRSYLGCVALYQPVLIM